MKILAIKNIPLVLAYKKLLECQEKGFAVKSIARRTMELAEVLRKCEQPEELYEQLLSLGLSDLTASMVVDVAPRTEDEVKILLNFESSASDEIVPRVLSLVESYCRGKSS